MSIGRALIGISVLATSISVFSQTPETKPPDSANSRATASQSSATPAPTPCAASAAFDQVEVLTDTMGVDFGPYLTRITKIVRQNWYDMMPLSVYPPASKQGKLSIEFKILKSGEASGMVVHSSSGDVALDRAAWRSIMVSTPFPPLPPEFRGPHVGLRFYFLYNLTLDSIAITVSPCVNIQVLAGSTLQFSASGKGITDTSVTWSVSGPGCANLGCGTISNSGLYTAPATIPSPPTVIVAAKSRTDDWVSGKSKLTVVTADPSH